jgi:prepilin-type N-terminal cleavage/methylation domain-containing protein
MRKLMSKKGFTLVELMIVVVILGILVAVAVPIFGAVTKNARIKSCKSNQRVIKGNMETFMMTGGTGGEAITLTSATTYDVSGESSFTKLFDGGTLPKCPSADSATNNYNAQVVFDGTNTNYVATCKIATTDAENHNG